MNYDKAYDQVASPSSGGTIRAGKDPANCDDALGKPQSQNQHEFDAKPEPKETLKALVEKQLGSNGYQGN